MIHVIINPAAGQNVPILSTINDAFGPRGIKWDVSITLKAGDAQKQAQQAAADGAEIVAVYGGDGTVVEAASGLIDSDIPLAILPGGTANVVAQELTIPLDLASACRLISWGNARKRQIDMGTVNDRHFLLRVGIGAEARITEKADRELKNKLGFFAYIWSAAQSLTSVKQIKYFITIDGEEITIDGITCGIINSGNLGLGNLQIGPDISIDDGLIDVIVISKADLPALAELVSRVLGLPSKEQQQLLKNNLFNFDGSIEHWRGKDVRVRTFPPQQIQYDGEMMDAEELHCKVLPKAITFLVPPISYRLFT